MPKISNIEEKIIKDVYKLESRQIIQTVVKFTVFFDLLELFNEDAEIIKNYFWETAITFFDETPKTNLILILIFITLILFLILLILQNYKKVVNKLTSLFHFYKSQRQ